MTPRSTTVPCTVSLCLCANLCTSHHSRARVHSSTPRALQFSCEILVSQANPGRIKFIKGVMDAEYTQVNGGRMVDGWMVEQTGSRKVTFVSFVDSVKWYDTGRPSDSTNWCMHTNDGRWCTCCIHPSQSHQSTCGVSARTTMVEQIRRMLPLGEWTRNLCDNSNIRPRQTAKKKWSTTKRQFVSIKNGN